MVRFVHCGVIFFLQPILLFLSVYFLGHCPISLYAFGIKKNKTSNKHKNWLIFFNLLSFLMGIFKKSLVFQILF